MRRIAALCSGEWSGKIVDCALRAALAAVLAGAKVFGGYAPLALGFAAAAGDGAPGMSAALGAAAGALVFLDFSHALRTCAALVLIAAAKSALGELKIYQKRAFLPVMTAAAMLAVEFVYLLRDGVGAAAPCAVSLALAAAGAVSARSIFEKDEGAQQPYAALPVVLGVLMALASYQTANGFAPGRIAAMLAVLLLGFSREEARVGLGLAVGLAMDLAAGTGDFLHAACYALCAAAAGAARRGDRVRAALWFCACLVGFALPLPAETGLVLLYEGLSAALAFLLIPAKYFRARRLMERSEDGAEETRRLRTAVTESAAALRELYDSVARAPAQTEENPAAIFDRAAERTCRDCALCAHCWEKDYERTYTALNDATAGLLRRGKGKGEDFPAYFVDRCVRFPSFLAAVNDELRAYLLRRQYRRRLADDHARAASQYAQLSELLHSAAESAAARPASARVVQGYKTGLALRPKKGERVSGDSARCFECGEGTLCLLLSDGMGCGESAQRESAMAARLLERFLRAGIDASAALRTLNGAFALRAESTESFTTVDLLCLSLNTLEGELYKYGAAPSYIKRGGAVKRVTCSCLPAGLVEGAPPPEATHLSLVPGSFLVMLSDGAADALDDEWLQDLLAGWEGEEPQQLAAAILAESIARRGESDDSSVLALYLPEGTGEKRAV